MNNRHKYLLQLNIIVVTALVIMVIPIVNAGFYAGPIADDFVFSRRVHDALAAQGGIIPLLKAAVYTAKATYNSWQGTFAAVFIFALQPGVFSPSLYGLTTVLMLGSLICSTYIFIGTCFTKLMHMGRVKALLVSTLILINMIQFVPDKVEAFFWYNGSSYYTLFYCLSLLLFSAMIRLAITEKPAIPTVIAAALAFVIGGGNYTTALLCAEIEILFIIFFDVKRNKRTVFFVLVAAAGIAALIISVVAPGNSVRADMVDGLSPVKAIALSILYAARFVGLWTRLPQIVILMIAFPILYVAADKSDFDFRWPAGVAVAAFLLFASQLTPPLYAMSTYGSGRQVDIYYYSYYLFALGIEYYIAGWIAGNTKAINAEEIIGICKKYPLYLFLTLAILWGVGCCSFGIRSMTTVDTTLAYTGGVLSEYKKQYNEMIETIEKAEPSDIVEVKREAVRPDFFLQNGISEDADNWINQGMAGYFGVRGIVLSKD